jgi:small subunit ribosomal protein S14
MAKTSMIVRANREPKYSTRKKNRCKLCGRPRAFMRSFALCRICFRQHALKGQLPGVKKSSW